MGHDDCRSVAFDGWGEDLTDANDAGVEAAYVEGSVLDEVVFAVEAEDVKVFLVELGHVAHEEIGCVGGSFYAGPVVGVSEQHASSELHSCFELGGLGRADAFYLLKLGEGSLGEADEAAEFGDDPGGHVEGCWRLDDGGDDLQGGERGWAVGVKPVDWSFAFGKLADHDGLWAGVGFVLDADEALL